MNDDQGAAVMGNMRLAITGIAALALAACDSKPAPVTYKLEQLVPGGSPFHGVHGMRFDPAGKLHAVSVIGRTIFQVDTETGALTTFVPPPQGMGDDLAFAKDGTVAWNAIEDGIVYARDPDGTIRHLMDNQRGVNGISFTPDGKRLFVSLVFYGDGLWELDLKGVRPPRQVTRELGGLNAFGIDSKGMIYGPVAAQGRMVRVNSTTGEETTVSKDFTRVGAVKVLDDRRAWVIDTGSLELKEVALPSGKTRVLAKLIGAADNFDVDAKGQVYYSVSDQNAIVRLDPKTGENHYVVPASMLNSAGGLAVMSANGVDTVYLGDLFGAVKAIDGQTGAITGIKVRINQASHVALVNGQLLVVGEPMGVIQLDDRGTGDSVRKWSGFNRPGDALLASNGDLIVAESGTGRLLRVTGEQAATGTAIASGLGNPRGLAPAGPAAVYLTEFDAGRVLRIELATGAMQVVATGLSNPEGIAVDANGQLVVVEVGAKRIVRIDPKDGKSVLLAADLPLGLVNGFSMYRGVAVGANAIYFNSDVKNTVFRLTPQH
jgi:sugar lactone lactonase YvrE